MTLAAFPWKRLFTHFDVWTVLFWINVAIVIVLITTLRVSLRRDKAERVPANLDPFLDDEALEGPHLERVLGWALFFFAIFAVTLPLYWLREASRGKATVSYFEENAIKRGEVLFSNSSMPNFDAALSLQCANCHGAKGTGGFAPYTYTDPNTGVAHSAQWKAPALNTVLYRFSPSEVNTIITLGRPGSPMVSWGVDQGGTGPKNAQSINDLVSFLISIQLPPGDAKTAAADLKGCQAAEPVEAKTALGQAACAQDAWKSQPAQQRKKADEDLATAKKTLADDQAQYQKLGCRTSFELDDAAAKNEPDAKKQTQAFADRDECRLLRLKLEQLDDPATPVGPQAVKGAQDHLAALKAATPVAGPDEIAAAQKTLDDATAALKLDTEDYGKKGCRNNAKHAADDAACARLARALFKQKFVATDLEAVTIAQANANWAKTWQDRRANVSDGQILFETNCARCHTKNWSIFDPTKADLKPEDLLGQPGNGGSIGFNLSGGAMQQRFPNSRGATGEITPNSGQLTHAQFVNNGSVVAQLYGAGGRGSGMMPGQCNTLVKSDASAPKLRYYGCMLSSASQAQKPPWSNFTDNPGGGEIDGAMIEQIIEFERCGLDRAKNDLKAVDYPSTCN